jgi:hypothetical protein
METIYHIEQSRKRYTKRSAGSFFTLPFLSSNRITESSGTSLIALLRVRSLNSVKLTLYRHPNFAARPETNDVLPVRKTAHLFDASWGPRRAGLFSPVGLPNVDSESAPGGLASSRSDKLRQAKRHRSDHRDRVAITCCCVPAATSMRVTQSAYPCITTWTECAPG